MYLLNRDDFTHETLENDELLKTLPPDHVQELLLLVRDDIFNAQEENEKLRKAMDEIKKEISEEKP